MHGGASAGSRPPPASAGESDEKVRGALDAALAAAQPQLDFIGRWNMVNSLLGCLHGAALDLSQCEASVAALLASVPALLSILDRHPRAMAAGGIRTIELSPTLSVGDRDGRPSALIDALGLLPSLEHVTVTTPPDSHACDIDFGRLQMASGRQPEFHFRGTSMRDLKLFVPCGTRVTGTAPPSGAIYKPVVFQVSLENGQQVVDPQPQPLYGFIYNHQIKGVDPGSFDYLQVQATQQNFNMKSFAIDDGRTVVCRHLASDWADKRIKYQASKAAGEDSGTKDFYLQYLPEAIRQIAREDLERRVIKAVEPFFFKKRPGFDGPPGAFGDLLARKFGSVRGGSAHFIARTPNHVLGVELLVKTHTVNWQVREHYVVNIFDPNRTTTHRRVVVDDLAQLMSKSLQDWLEPGDVAMYFPEGSDLSIHLLEWPPERSSLAMDATLETRIDHQVANVLMPGLLEGDAESVKDTMAGLLLQLPALTSAQRFLLLRLLACHDPANPLLDSIGNEDSSPASGKTVTAVSAYMTAVLNSPLVTDAEKLAFCAVKGPQGVTSARYALDRGALEVAAGMLLAVLRAPVSSAVRQQWLAGMAISSVQMMAAIDALPVQTQWAQQVRTEIAALTSVPLIEPEPEPVEGPGSMAFLSRAMQLGDVDDVRANVRAMATRAARAAPGTLESLLLCVFDDEEEDDSRVSALHLALVDIGAGASAPRTDALVAYVQEVLAIPSEVLGSDVKRRILAAREAGLTVLDRLLLAGLGDTAKAFHDAVTSVADTSLGAADKAHVLLPNNTAIVGGPRLAELMCRLTSEPRMDAFVNHLRRLVRSPFLTDAQMHELFTPMTPMPPAAAGAMLLVVLELDRASPLRAALLTRIGQDPRAVVSRLRKQPQAWLKQIGKQISTESQPQVVTPSQPSNARRSLFSFPWKKKPVP